MRLTLGPLAKRQPGEFFDLLAPESLLVDRRGQSVSPKRYRSARTGSNTLL